MTIVSLHQKLEKKTIFNRLAHHTIHGAHIDIATDSIKQKRSKAIDMRFHWDRVRQGQFIISYIKSADNIADYFTKKLGSTQT
jgi:hypothetical protein